MQAIFQQIVTIVIYLPPDLVTSAKHDLAWRVYKRDQYYLFYCSVKVTLLDIK